MPLIVSHPRTVIDQSDRPLLEVIAHILPPARIAAAVAAVAQPRQRRRKLPGEVVMLLFIALHLVPPAALDVVLASLLAGRRARAAHQEVPASASAISHARYRWGAKPLIALFHQTCRPLATPATPGAWLEEWRLMALDSSIDAVADTVANERAFGRHHTRYGGAAYPQFLGMYLSECGTRAIVDAGIWPVHADVHRAARRLLRRVTAEMLVLYDQGLHSFALAAGIRQRGAHVLARVPPGQTFEVVRPLPDGSLLARLWDAPPGRRTSRTERMLVRVLPYTLTDPTRPGAGKPHRLMTSLLDHERFPALRLICVYHERWEIETAFDEMGSSQRLAAAPFRAQHPVGVLQEVYGLLLAHYAVRAVIHDAACRAHMDPDRVSFTHAVRLLALAVPMFQVLEPEQHATLYDQLLADIARYRLPRRSLRVAPRAIKRPRSKHRVRGRDPAYQIVRVRPFAEVVSLLLPNDVERQAAACA